MNFISQALLTPPWEALTFRSMDGGWAGRKVGAAGVVGGEGGEMWLGCNMKNK